MFQVHGVSLGSGGDRRLNPVRESVPRFKPRPRWAGRSFEAMISQIVTLVGVLIGALTSYLATAMAERARHQRAMATRWDERKLQAYLEYASCAKEIADFAKRAWRAREGSESRQEFLAAMEEAERRRSVLFETLVLLGSPAAISCANEVNLALWDGLKAARDHVVPPERDFAALMNAYHEQARLDLGVPRTDVRYG